MANANEITEQVKLLLNVPTVGDNAQFSQEVNQFLADADHRDRSCIRLSKPERGTGLPVSSGRGVGRGHRP